MQLDQTDLALIAEALRRNFTTQELEDSGFLDRQPTVEVRRELADLDFLFFCQFYLRSHFYLPPADIHRDLAVYIGEIINTAGPTNDAIAWPRGHAKTTMVSLGLPLYVVTPAEPRVRYTILGADSHDQSKAYLSTIKDELEHDARILEDWGSLRGPKWQSDHVELSNRSCIEALGRGMKIRGRKYLQYRPGLIILDDLEEIERTQSPTNREADSEWLARSVMKAGAPDCKLFVIGTIIHYDSVLSRLLKNPLFRHRRYQAVVEWSERPDLWAEWAQLLTDLADEDRMKTARAFFDEHSEAMLEGTQVAWGERYSYYDLMVMKVTGEGLTEGSSFEAEMQNEPIDPERRYFKHIGRFRQEWRQPVLGEPGDIWLVPLGGRPAVPLSSCAVFGAIDPSLGQKTKAKTDPCAVIVLAKAPTGQMFVIENQIDWLTPDQMIQAMLEYGARYTFVSFAVEAVQFQYLFATDAARASAQANIYLPVVPVQQTANKQLRIQSMQPDLSNEYILLPDRGAEVLLEQLEGFPLWGEDDGPDALELARRIAKQWQGTAPTTAVHTDAHRFEQEHLPRHMQPASGDPFHEYEVLADEMALRAQVEQELEQARQRAREELEAEAPPGRYPWYPRIR